MPGNHAIFSKDAYAPPHKFSLDYRLTVEEHRPNLHYNVAL